MSKLRVVCVLLVGCLWLFCGLFFKLQWLWFCVNDANLVYFHFV